MKIAYDGTRYSGWQIQNNSSSIQDEIQKALSTALRKSMYITGAGRTDQGVHARAQGAHFEVEELVDTHKLLKSMNGILPWDIRIKSVDLVDNDFHARFSAKAKIYHYHFWLEEVIDPFFFPYRLHMQKPFDPKRVIEACPYFLGEKDFTTFANIRVSGHVCDNAVRKIYRLDAIMQEGGMRLEFEGNGFLYKMVRNIVGVLIEIGQKRREKESIEVLFAAKDRKAINAPAPARGLFLYDIIY